MRSFPRSRLDGPPVALHPALDRLSEQWWSLRPRHRMLVVVLLAAVAAVAGPARLAASPHGPPTSVLVATRDLPVGHDLVPDDLRVASWPRDLVPAGAVTEPRGTVTGPLPQGAVATSAHLAPPGSGVAAAVPADRVAVTIPAELLPPLPAGARLDLVAPDPDGTPRVIASSATVVAAETALVWIAVDPPEAPALAAATARGQVVAILRPP
jgi:pilus assembly protein CpaB